MVSPYKPRKRSLTGIVWGVLSILLMVALLFLVRHQHQQTEEAQAAKVAERLRQVSMTDPLSDDSNTPTDEQTQAVTDPKATGSEATNTSPPKTPSTAVNNTRGVVWEMSQNDPTKASPPPSAQATQTTATENTPIDQTPTVASTKPQTDGSQSILHPDDIPANEHGTLPHLARTTSQDGKSGRVEVGKVVADKGLYADTQPALDESAPTTPKGDAAPAPDDEVLQEVKQLLETNE